MWLVEGARPDRWDIVGALICLGGAAIICLRRVWRDQIGKRGTRVASLRDVDTTRLRQTIETKIAMHRPCQIGITARIAAFRWLPQR